MSDTKTNFSNEKKTNSKSRQTLIENISELEEKVDYENFLREENLLATIEDLSIPQELRLEAIELYRKNHDSNEIFEIINKLAIMYQFSGLKLLRSYLYSICTETTLHPFFKTIIVKSLCAHNKNDEIGYKALDIIYPSMGTDVPIPCKVEIVILLMNCKKYKERARDYFCTIINDEQIECDYRYKTILSLEYLIETKETCMYFTREACLEIVNHKNPTRYRILAAQYLLQRCNVTEEQKNQIEQIMLSFCDDTELDYNVRADSADVLLQLGNDVNQIRAREVIFELGRQNKLICNVYDNAQNVHIAEIDKSALEIIEFLAQMPTMMTKSKEDLEEEKNTKKTVAGIEIGFDYVKAKVLKMIEEEKSERDEKINISLDRIFMDQALYSEYNVNLKTILVKVWTYIQGHEHEREMQKRLLQELEEMSGTCSTGYANRLVNTITGFGDFNLRISWRDQIISNLGGRLNARARIIDDLDFQEKVLCEMSIQSCDYQSRKHFLRFFRQNLLSIREELYQEFKSWIDDATFDLAFRAAIATYEGSACV